MADWFIFYFPDILPSFPCIIYILCTYKPLPRSRICCGICCLGMDYYHVGRRNKTGIVIFKNYCHLEITTNMDGSVKCKNMLHIQLNYDNSKHDCSKFTVIRSFTTVPSDFHYLKKHENLKCNFSTFALHVPNNKTSLKSRCDFFKVFFDRRVFFTALIVRQHKSIVRSWRIQNC